MTLMQPRPIDPQRDLPAVDFERALQEGGSHLCRAVLFMALHVDATRHESRKQHEPLGR